MWWRFPFPLAALTIPTLQEPHEVLRRGNESRSQSWRADPRKPLQLWSPLSSPKAPQGAAGWAKLLFHTEALLQGPEELVNCQLLIVIWMRQPQQWGLLGNISQALGEAAAISEVASRSRTTLGRGWDPQHLPVHCGARVVIPIYCVPIKHGITLNILK